MTDLKSGFIMHCWPKIRWTFVLLALSACSNEMVQAPPASNVIKTTQPKINYESLTVQATQQLDKAKKLIAINNNQSALQTLDLISYASLSNEQRSLFNLLSAQIALSNADADSALTKLAIVRPILLNEYDKISYYQTLAFAQSLKSNILAAVNARIRLGSLLTTPSEQQDNIKTILNLLSTLSLDELSAPSDTLNDLNGWLSLAKIFKQRDQNGFDLNQQIEIWRQQNPVHPANAEFLQTYLKNLSLAAVNTTPSNSTNSAKVAVFLPETGSYAQAGKAIKAGLLAAQKQTASGLPLKFYDTEQSDMVNLYQKALAEGAEQIIGPLLKEQIEVLAKTELSVPVLALNHVEDLVKTNLYQFGLSPIDDANELALKAWRDGHQTAIILMPNTSLGQRTGQYLTTAWQGLGGSILGVQSYDSKQHDIADILTALLSAINSLPNQTQTVFISATPEIASELSLKLKTKPETALAIYAMPNIYRAHPNPIQDADLSKIVFCDIPWLFAETYNGSLSQTALQNSWQNLGDNQIRLMALGIDAYQLLGQLPQLTSRSFSGATGHLSLNNENRVTRKLVCAQFQAGLPIISGFIE